MVMCRSGLHERNESDAWRTTNGSRCRECRKITVRKWRQRNPGYDKKWYRDNPEKSAILQRRKHLKRLYGLSIEQYEAMLSSQGGVCSICGGLCKKRLSVDHDHATGQIRGLLCSKCNFAIGLLESPEKLAAAQSYLTRWSQQI
jgi:hypothetical protein